MYLYVCQKKRYKLNKKENTNGVSKKRELLFFNIDIIM